MSRIILSLALLSVCASSVLAHNWLVTPVERATPTGDAANTVAPCGKAGAAKRYTIAERGSTHTLTWKNNHGPPTHTVNLFPGDTFQNPVFTTSQNPPAGDNPNFSTTMTIPEDVLPGHYTLQWKWATYYSCHDYKVVDSSMTDSGDGVTFRLADDKGSFNVLTGEYTCDEEGVEPVESKTEGVMACDPNAAGSDVVGRMVTSGSIFAFALILLCGVAVLGLGLYMLIIRQANPTKYSELTGNAAQWN